MKPVTVVVAIVVGALLVCFGGAAFFGGTKVRRLFGASAEALAGDDRPAVRPRPDAGVAVADAGAP